MYDVIIVGAGPAGTCCAKKLAENGFSVIVYDRRREIGSPKRCGEGLSESIKDYIGEIPERCIAQRIRGSRIYAPNNKSVDAMLEYGGFVLERKVFDKWLAEKAIAAGAKIQSDSFVTELIKEDGKIVGVRGEFVGDSFEERAKVVVCATGAESPLRKHALGIFSKPELIDSCLQYEMSGIDVDPNFIHIYLGNKISPRGYVWVFPKGKDRANVGVGIVPGEKNAKYYLNSFIASRPELSKGSIIEVNGGCIPVGGMTKDMVTDGFVVCGEAAHQVNPIHGGGIKEAVVSGILAADVISECIKNNDVSKQALSKFNTLWWEDRGNKMRKVERLREVMEKLSDDDLNDLADTLDPRDIIEFTRGTKLSVLAKVLMRKPSLVKLAKHLV